jgi:hypothetical protein
MADSRLKQYSALDLHIAERAYRLFKGFEFFIPRFLRRTETTKLPETRDEIIEQIMRSQHCHCRRPCAHCQHIINDVVPDNY